MSIKEDRIKYKNKIEYWYSQYLLSNGVPIFWGMVNNKKYPIEIPKRQDGGNIPYERFEDWILSAYPPLTQLL